MPNAKIYANRLAKFSGRKLPLSVKIPEISDAGVTSNAGFHTGVP